MSSRRARALASLAACALATGTLGSCGVARDVLYAPRAGPIDIGDWTNSPPQTVHVTTQDHLRLTGYFWRGAQEDRDIFVFFNGRNAHQGVGAKYAQYLLGRGDSVLVASLRGFGGNPGHPSRNGVAKDATAFIGEAQRLVGTDARLWLVGHSLGGAIAINAAVDRHDIAGVIAISTFSRVTKAAPWVARPFVPDKWDNIAALAHVTAPLLILQGDKDDVIPASSGRELVEAAHGPVAYIAMAGETHKPPMQTLGPWISAAIATMSDARIDHLPPLDPNWTLKALRP